MLKRSFFSLGPSQIVNALNVDRLKAPEPVAEPAEVILYLRKSDSPSKDHGIAPGMEVQAGQLLAVSTEPGHAAVVPASGTVSAIFDFMGDFGKAFTGVKIAAAEADVASHEDFEQALAEPTLETLLPYLCALPGQGAFEQLVDTDNPIDTIVISGADQDLMVATNRYVARNAQIDLKNGIAALKKISGIETILVAVHRDTVQGYDGHLGAPLVAVDTAYPASFPVSIMRDVLELEVPAGKTPSQLGVCFLSAESVVSLGKAFDSGRLPMNKTITLIDKTNQMCLIEATVGTPVGRVLQQYGVTLEDRDRVIFGGPLTGAAVFSDEQPILPDTDAIFIQAADRVPLSSDQACFNCGECVRICPAKVPVNMLVRFLAASQYETGADEYDLYSCIECGLCSFVCVSRIPIFQYIKLAKYELERANQMAAELEADDDA